MGPLELVIIGAALVPVVLVLRWWERRYHHPPPVDWAPKDDVDSTTPGHR